MREPGFWHGPSSLKSHLLRPLGALYGAIAARRLQRKGLDAGIPVLCVGNYHVGGAGKTPTVLALAKLLRELGETPVVLSRGYGGKLRGPVKVDPARHAAADVGDEPLMLAATLPVVVARHRADGIPMARSLGASVILMDDGFQSPVVVKDASLIVIDGRPRPRQRPGVSRRPLARAAMRPQIARTDALVIVGNGSGRRRGCGRDCRAGQAGVARPSQTGCSVGRAAWRQARAGLCRHRRSRAVLCNAHGQRYRSGPIARLRRPSSVFESRDRRFDRRSQSRRADAGDDGKGSGAAANRRRSCRIGRKRSCRSP